MRTLRAARIRAPCTAATNLVARGCYKLLQSWSHLHALLGTGRERYGGVWKRANAPSAARGRGACW